MSTPFDPTILTRRCDIDVSSSEYLLVVPSGDDTLALAGAGAAVLGALTNDVADGSSTAVYVPVQVGGIIKVKTAEAFTAGQLATSDGSGNAVIANSSGDYFFGVALETHVSGDIGAFLWAPGGQVN